LSFRDPSRFPGKHPWQHASTRLYRQHGGDFNKHAAEVNVHWPFRFADKANMVSPAQSRLIEAELAPGRLREQVSASIASKAHQVEKQQGAAVLQLLEDAATQDRGNGLGGRLDLTA
jgi:hypothetical protein